MAKFEFVKCTVTVVVTPGSICEPTVSFTIPPLKVQVPAEMELDPPSGIVTALPVVDVSTPRPEMVTVSPGEKVAVDANVIFIVFDAFLTLEDPIIVFVVNSGALMAKFEICAIRTELNTTLLNVAVTEGDTVICVAVLLMIVILTSKGVFALMFEDAVKTSVPVLLVQLPVDENIA